MLCHLPNKAATILIFHTRQFLKSWDPINIVLCKRQAASHSYSAVPQIMKSNHVVPQIMGSNQCDIIYAFLVLFARR